MSLGGIEGLVGTLHSILSIKSESLVCICIVIEIRHYRRSAHCTLTENFFIILEVTKMLVLINNLLLILIESIVSTLPWSHTIWYTRISLLLFQARIWDRTWYQLKHIILLYISILLLIKFNWNWIIFTIKDFDPNLLVFDFILSILVVLDILHIFSIVYRLPVLDFLL